MQPELIERLDNAALLIGVSRAEIIRKFLHDGLDRLNKMEVTNE